MKETRVWIFCLVITALPAWPSATVAQDPGRIEGHVMTAESSRPLYGANIVVKGTLLGGAARSDGTYFVTRIPEGQYEIEASMMGYKK